MLSQKIWNNSQQEDVIFSSPKEQRDENNDTEEQLMNKAPILIKLREKKRIKYFKKNNLKLHLNKVIGNNNGKWTKSEKMIFIECFIESGNEWNRLEDLISTRNRGQIRSHAQKFFERLSKIFSDERRKVIITPDSFSKFIWPLAHGKKLKIKEILVNLFLNDSHTFDYINNKNKKNNNNNENYNLTNNNNLLYNENNIKFDFNYNNIYTDDDIIENDNNVKTNEKNIEFYDLGSLKEEIVDFCENKLRSINEITAKSKKKQPKKKLTNIKYFEIRKIPKPIRKLSTKETENNRKNSIKNLTAIEVRRMSFISGKSNESSSTIIEEDKQIIL